MSEMEWWTDVWLPMLGIVVPGLVGLAGLAVAVLAQRQTQAVTRREAARTDAEAEERRAIRAEDAAERRTKEERELRESIVGDVMRWAAGEFAAMPKEARPRADSVADLTLVQTRLLTSGMEGADTLSDILWLIDSLGPVAREAARVRNAIAGRALSKVREAVAHWTRDPEVLEGVREAVTWDWYGSILEAAEAAKSDPPERRVFIA